MTTLSSSQNPSAFNQSVTFTATVTPNGGAALTGTVAFMDGSTTLATVALSNGSQPTPLLLSRWERIRLAFPTGRFARQRQFVGAEPDRAKS